MNLQPLIDKHVGCLLLEGRRGLLLGGDGEETFALVDVIVGDRVVVDEYLDRDFLGGDGGETSDQNRDKERGDKPGPIRQGCADPRPGAGPLPLSETQTSFA